MAAPPFNQISTKVARILSRAALLLALICRPLYPVQAAAPPWKSYVLDQESHFYGKMQLTITDKALRMSFQNLGIAVLALPPQPGTKEIRFVALNDTDRAMYETTLTKWEHDVARVRHYQPSGPSRPFKQTKRTATIAGLKAYLYTNSGHVFAYPELKDRAMGSDPQAAWVEEMWNTTEVPLPKNFDAVIGAITATPSGSGVPLRVFRRVEATHQKIETLDTTKCERKVVPESAFKVPTGYRKVNSYMDLMLGGSPFAEDMESAGNKNSASGGSKVSPPTSKNQAKPSGAK